MQSAQLIVILFPLVICTVQGTHAVVAAFFIPARYTRKIWYKLKHLSPTQCNNYTSLQNWTIHLNVSACMHWLFNIVLALLTTYHTLLLVDVLTEG